MEEGVDVAPWDRFPLMVLPKHHVIRHPPIATIFMGLTYNEMHLCLFPDNLLLAERLETLQALLAPAKTLNSGRWCPSWVSSFASYIAVVAQAHPEWVADMLFPHLNKFKCLDVPSQFSWNWGKAAC